MFATVDGWILSFSAVTVIVTIWMGFRSAKTSKTASDFFVAGRSVSVGWNASAISGEYLSAASFMGIAGMVMSSGYDALWYPVCYACGYLFLLLFIAGPLRRFGAYTIPDFAEGRYDSPLFRKIAVCFVLFIGFFYTMPQMKGAGTTLAYIFPGLPYWAGVVLVGAVITLNVALGGMKGITLVQAFQYWAKMFAISVPIFVLMAVYGHYGKQLEVNGNVQHPTNAASAAALSVEYFSLPEKSKAANGSIAVSTGMTLPVVDGWVTIEPPGSIAQIEQRFKELAGKGQSWRNVGDAKLVSVLMELSEHEGRRVIAHTNLNLVRMLGNMTVDQTNRLGAAAQLRSFLAGKEVCLLETGAGDVLAVQKNQEAGYRAALDAERGFGTLRKALPEKAPKDETWLSPFGPLTTKAAKAANLSPEETKSYSLLYTYSLIIALICGTAGLPHILVRFYTNPDGGAAKRTTMWVMILIGIFYVFPPVFGVMGRNLFPELYSGIGAKGTDKIVLELPRLLNEKYAPLGSILSGITCAGAFAAFMSTFSGLLVSMTGALAHDVYGRMLRPKSTPEQRMRMFKFAAVLIGFVSILLGSLVEPLEINFMVGQAFAIAAASYFPLLFMSVWWRGMTMRGAAVGMLTGGLCALIAATLTNVSNLALDKGPMGKIFSGFAGMNDFWAQHPLLRILCEQPAIWTVPLAITLMIVVSKATRKDVPSDVRMKMLVLHAPEKLGLKQEYIQEHQGGGH
jgi:cation/acetate symporter